MPPVYLTLESCRPDRQVPAKLRKALDRAISVYGSAHFECGEWDRNESVEKYDAVHDRAIRAERKLWHLITRCINEAR